MIQLNFLLGNCIIDYIFFDVYIHREIKDDFNKDSFFNNYINPVILEGDEMILLDCEKTKFPEHYNEGVYAWMENRKICTTLEYHESKGGDPEVLHAWLKSNGKNPDFHPM